MPRPSILPLNYRTYPNLHPRLCACLLWLYSCAALEEGGGTECTFLERAVGELIWSGVEAVRPCRAKLAIDRFRSSESERKNDMKPLRETRALALRAFAVAIAALTPILVCCTWNGRAFAQCAQPCTGPMPPTVRTETNIAGLGA